MKLKLTRRQLLVMGILGIIALSIGSTVAYLSIHRQTTRHVTQKNAPSTSSAPQTPAPAAPAPVPKPALVEPIAEFRARITKKFFGTYITPSTSPVQPERFSGYHAGVDVEYGDVSTSVPVHAVADGQVVYAGWVSGYGGVCIVRHQINGAAHLVLYGHLNPDSLAAVGANVTQGQQIGELGTAYSHQTDGERRHLHFAVLAGNTIDYRGYATSKAGLSAWIDPLSLTYGG